MKGLRELVRTLRAESIFVRLLLSFVLVGLAVGGPLVYLSLKFNRESTGTRAQQNIEQQIAIIKSNFEQEFGDRVRSSLKTLTSSEALATYMAASNDERSVNAKIVENQLLRVEREHEGFSGIYYADAKGSIVVSAQDRKRQAMVGSIADAFGADGPREGQQTRIAAKALFQNMRSVPLLLSSGNMEWFMPPREVVVEGPFADERGRLSFLAGLPLIDMDSGAFGGIMFIRVDLQRLVQRLRTLRFFDANPIWLYAADGKVLAQPQDGRSSFDPAPYFAQGAALETKSVAAGAGLIAYQDLSIVPGAPFIRIAYAVPQELLLKDFETATRFFFLVLVVASVLVFAVAFFLSKKLSTPIVGLASAASRLSAGDLSARVDIAATGELKVLVESFNTMSENLQIADRRRSRTFEVLRRTAGQLQSESSNSGASPVDLEQVLDEIDHGEIDLGGGDAEHRETEDLRGVSEMIIGLFREREANLRDIRAAMAVADEANKAKGDFLATMSHEIRTPLNAVIGLSEVLSGSALEAGQRELVETMEAAGRQLLAIINDVLDFSELQSTGVELSDARLEVRPFIGTVMMMIEGLPGAARLEIGCEVDDSVPAAFMVDPQRLMQILTNLLGNAVKFTPQGTVVLRVVAGRSGAGEPTIRFEVSDSGPGIAAEFRAKVFEPFNQVRRHRLTPHAGSGLGLSICSKLAQTMGGSVTLAEKSGPGALFVLELPLRLVEVRPAVSASSGSAPGALAPLRILVAEDTAANQLVIRLFLQRLGHTVSMVWNGKEALDAFLAGTFDVVFLDIQMPVMNGFEAVSAIRASGPSGSSVPIVALTAFAKGSDRDEARACGFSGFLAKPIRAADVERILGEVVVSALGRAA